MDDGLVVKHPVANMEFGGNVKIKFESLRLPRQKRKLTRSVGVASEARKFPILIKITEKDLKDLTKSEISGVPSSNADKNSKRKERKWNATQTFKSNHFTKH